MIPHILPQNLKNISNNDFRFIFLFLPLSAPNQVFIEDRHLRALKLSKNDYLCFLENNTFSILSKQYDTFILGSTLFYQYKIKILKFNNSKETYFYGPSLLKILEIGSEVSFKAVPISRLL